MHNQTRTCTDSNDCGTTVSKPPESQPCEEDTGSGCSESVSISIVEADMGVSSFWNSLTDVSFQSAISSGDDTTLTCCALMEGDMQRVSILVRYNQYSEGCSVFSRSGVPDPACAAS